MGIKLVPNKEDPTKSTGISMTNFLTGIDRSEMPVYSEDTVGNLYFITDITSSNSSEWKGEIIFDSPVMRMSMTSRADQATKDGEGKNIANTYVPFTGGDLTGGISISGVKDGSALAYGGGAYNNIYNNIILKGDKYTGLSGLLFTSTNGDNPIGAQADRAFIQYNPRGIRSFTQDGINPDNKFYGDKGHFVIGVGGDEDDMLYLQTKGFTSLQHIVGQSAYVIPTVAETTGSAGYPVVTTGIEGQYNHITDIKFENGKVYADKFVGDFDGAAAEAEFATKDGDGNVITDTYLKLAGGTMNGGIKMQSGDNSINNYGITFTSSSSLSSDTDGELALRAIRGLTLRSNDFYGIKLSNKILAPELNRQISLGSADIHFKSLFVGTKETYGSSSLPIYWDNGVPREITNYEGNAATADKVNHQFVIIANNGNVEETSKYTFDGSKNKVLNFTGGDNVTVTAKSGEFEISSPALSAKTSTGQGSNDSTTDTSVLGGITVSSHEITTVKKTIGGADGITVSGATTKTGEITVKHSNSITALNSYSAEDSTENIAADGGSFVIRDIKYDAQGHITETRDRTINLSQHDNDTKNTAGATESGLLMYLVGATAQGENPQTYTNQKIYTKNENISVTGEGGVVTEQTIGAVYADAFHGTADKVANKLWFGNSWYDGSSEGRVTAADLGIINSMAFMGTTDCDITTADNESTSAVEGYKNRYEIHIPTKGDWDNPNSWKKARQGSVVIYKSTTSSGKTKTKQYYWDCDDEAQVWLGQWVPMTPDDDEEGSSESTDIYKLTQEAVNSGMPEYVDKNNAGIVETATSFIAALEQDEQGVVRPHIRQMDTSGTWSGTANVANSAKKLIGADNLAMNVGSIDTPVYFENGVPKASNGLNAGNLAQTEGDYLILDCGNSVYSTSAPVYNLQSTMLTTNTQRLTINEPEAE